jgi:hypothetical protein
VFFIRDEDEDVQQMLLVHPVYCAIKLHLGDGFLVRVRFDVRDKALLPRVDADKNVGLVNHIDRR